jgi:hypothetical protein
MKQLTFRQVRSQLRDIGYTISWSIAGEELRVCKKGDSEASAYYTNDFQDALDTGRAMARGAAL